MGFDYNCARGAVFVGKVWNIQLDSGEGMNRSISPLYGFDNRARNLEDVAIAVMLEQLLEAQPNSSPNCSCCARHRIFAGEYQHSLRHMIYGLDLANAFFSITV